MGYFVTVEVTTTDDKVKRSFEANVKAEYGSLVTEVSGKVGVKGSESFKKFQSVERRKIKNIGGDPAKANLPCNAGFEGLLHVTPQTIQDVLKRHTDENVPEGAAALGEFILLASGRSASLRRINRQPKLSAYDPSFEMISPVEAIMPLKLIPEVFNGLGNYIF